MDFAQELLDLTQEALNGFIRVQQQQEQQKDESFQ